MLPEDKNITLGAKNIFMIAATCATLGKTVKTYKKMNQNFKIYILSKKHKS